jgi:two-component system cell cycle response regulator
MEDPKQLFLKETLGKIPKLRKAIDILSEEPGNKTCINILHIFFHSVYGTGSTLGYGEVVEPAKRIEDMLSSLLLTGQAVEADLLKNLEEMAATLEEKFNLIKTTEEIVLPFEQESLQEVPRKELLIVDDDAAIRQLISEELFKRNYGVAAAKDAFEAKKILEHYRPDLIILDVVMPGTNGLDLLKELRADHRFDWTPVFFLSGNSNPTEIIDGIKTGADDYILKPFNVEDLIARIEAKIKRMGQLHQKAIRDPLTGVFSRGYFMERLDEEIERFPRGKTPFSVIMCDLDFFKKVNDEHGHQTGDFVLQQFASFLYNKFRRVDIIGRYGGEEFIILLPGTEAHSTYNAMERLHSEWGKKALIEPFSNKNMQITFSAGISEFDRDGKTAQEIIKAADNALYLAKETGRDRVLLAHQANSDLAPNPRKILIVDDSAVMRILLLNTLKQDYQVYLAKDGADALFQMQGIKPDLVITDLIMPVMSGLEFTKTIRKDPQNKQLRIIALTSNTQKESVFEAIQAGVDDYIVKPFDMNEIVERIKRLLAKRKDR